jgi:type VI protein secretion system component VasK
MGRRRIGRAALAYVEYRNRLAERYPFSTDAPEDIASIVAFLASP